MGRFLLLALIAFQVRSETATEVSDLVKFYEAPTPGPCVFDASVLRPLPDRLPFEVAFSLTEKEGRCTFEFFATGVATGVRLPSDRLERALKDRDADVFNKMHSHPLDNVAYFAAGNPYAYEIMFADEEMIRARQLPAALFERLAGEVRRGSIPGYSLSPPSVTDFMGASTLWEPTGGPKKILNQVVCSGGVWTYAVDGAENQKKIRRALEHLVAYALQHEVASSDRFRKERREHAREIYEEGLNSEEWGPIIRAWTETGFELRAPYSAAAARAYFENGDASPIRAEFARKLEHAKRFGQIMRELGVEVSFEPFPDENEARM